MNLTVKPSDFAAAVKLAASAIPARTSLPICKNVLIEANGNSRIRLAATDIDTSVEAFIAADVTEQGSLTVREETLSDLLGGLNGSEEVKLEQAGDRVKILCGKAAYRLPTLRAEDFPALPVLSGEATTIRMPLGVLRDTITRVLPFVSEEATRPILTAVLFRVTETELTLAATDTHRLAVHKLSAAIGTTETRDFLVPEKALARLKNYSGKDDAEVVIALSGSLASFATSEWRMMTRLIDGQFPRYERIIPTEFSSRWELDNGELSAALRRVRVVAKDQVHKEMLAVHPYEGGLQLRALGAETGDGVEDVSLEQEGGAIDRIGLNARYLLDICTALGEGGKVKAGLNRPLDSVLLESSEPDRPRIILQPMDLSHQK